LTEPRITAVIPTFRRPRLLRRAVESVLAQTYPHVTVAIFDNASEDETAATVAELSRRDPRVRYHCHERNLGAIANFQAGLDAVGTPYFSFLSDDDFLLPGFYEHALRVLQDQPSAQLFCGQTVMYNPEDGSHKLHPGPDWREGLHPPGSATVQMIRSMFIWTGSLFSSEVGRAIGPLKRVSVVDTLFLAQAAARFPFVVSLQPCAVFTAAPDRTVHSMSPQELGEAYEVILAELAGMPEVSREQKKEIAELLEHFRGRILKYRLKRTFQAGNWEAFDQAVAFLRGRGELTYGMRIRSLVSALRKNVPYLVDTARRFYGRIEGLQRSRRSAGAPATPDELLARYGPALAGAGETVPGKRNSSLSGSGETGAAERKSGPSGASDADDQGKDRLHQPRSDNP
jgi:glycosyltransferase involved in cell wall biosynthesis